jgi:hypothetical protein
MQYFVINIIAGAILVLKEFVDYLPGDGYRVLRSKPFKVTITVVAVAVAGIAQYIEKTNDKIEQQGVVIKQQGAVDSLKSTIIDLKGLIIQRDSLIRGYYIASETILKKIMQN